MTAENIIALDGAQIDIYLLVGTLRQEVWDNNVNNKSQVLVCSSGCFSERITSIALMLGCL